MLQGSPQMTAISMKQSLPRRKRGCSPVFSGPQAYNLSAREARVSRVRSSGSWTGIPPTVMDCDPHLAGPFLGLLGRFRDVTN